MATWKRRSDLRKVCGNIFEDRNAQLYLNVHRRFGRDFVKSSGYTMIFILVYAESFKSIGMLAYRVSFCCCRSKVLFRCFRKFVFTEFLTTWVRVEIVMCDSRLVINSIFWSYSLHFLLALNAVCLVHKLHLQTNHHIW